MCHRIFGAAVLLVAVLGACSDPDERGLVTSSEFGTAWPFAFPSGTLGCDRGAVTIYMNGRTFALNENARAKGWHGPDEVLEDGLILGATGISEGKKSTKPLLERGLRLCEPPLAPGG